MALASNTTPVTELERIIGQTPGNDQNWVDNALTNELDGSPLRAQELIAALRAWTCKQGLPLNTVQAALPTSLIKAYNRPQYLKSWRNRVNPSWALLDAIGDEPNATIDNGTDKADQLNLPIWQPPTPTVGPQSSVQTEQWLKTLLAQIETTVNRLVKDKLDNTTLKLDEGAKAQIRDLASATTKNEIALLMPPRQIEITDMARGTVIAMGLQHERFPTLLRAIQARDHRGFRLNIWLTGPTGSGKTSAAEASAKALSLTFGSDGSLDADYKVLGFRDANGNIISTQFLNIYEHGGIYVADEIDNWLPSALLSLNAALANGFTASPRGLIRRHEDCCVIACANTWGLGATGDYVGRTRLDAASLDRFHPKIEWPYDVRMERAIASAQGGDVGAKWHDTVLSARAKAATQGLKIIISPRATFNGISLLLAGFTEAEVIDMTLAAGLSPEQKKAIGLSEAPSRMVKNQEEEQVWRQAGFSR